MITRPSGDLGNPDRTTWADRTRTYLNSGTAPGNNRNTVMWSWCGQVSSASETDINTYLNLMNQLETDYPAFNFVYMTGHLDGSGPSGNLYTRNNQIRAYAQANDKVLFDFADIESYDPAGNYYPNGSDACEWCDDWCSAHPGDCVDLPDSCAHSHPFNCYAQRSGVLVDDGAAGGVGRGNAVSQRAASIRRGLRRAAMRRYAETRLLVWLRHHLRLDHAHRAGAERLA